MLSLVRRRLVPPGLSLALTRRPFATAPAYPLTPALRYAVRLPPRLFCRVARACLCSTVVASSDTDATEPLVVSSEMELRKLNKYFMYKLYCKDSSITNIYVGMTNNIEKMLKAYRHNCLKRDTHVFKFIRENKGWDNWRCKELEAFYTSSEIEARDRKKHWIDVEKADLNRSVPNNKEWTRGGAKLKEYIRVYHRTYRRREKAAQQAHVHGAQDKEETRVKYLAKKFSLYLKFAEK